MSLPALRHRTAIYLDVVLLLAFLTLLSPRLTGLPVHEWLGLTLLLFVVVHLLLSWRWIAAGTKGVVTKSSRRSRVNYALNWLLFALIVLEIASGVAISAVALPFLGITTINDRAWRALHNQALNFTHIAVGLHVAMNWKPLLAGIRRYFAAEAP